MSANIGSDRICKSIYCFLHYKLLTLFLTARRKPGPKPRRVIPSSSSSQLSSINNSLNQLFAQADSPRPPSRNEGSDGGSSTSSMGGSCTIAGGGTTISPVGQKEGRPRNLGRGVSKPKKNTVASLLAQSRALGIKFDLIFCL